MVFVSVILAVVLGVLAGIFTPSVFANITVFFKILLLISSVVLLIYTLLLYNRQNRILYPGSPFKIIVSFLLFGVVGSFISAVIGLTLAVQAGASLSVLLGFATFFSLIALTGALVQFFYLLNSGTTPK